MMKKSLLLLGALGVAVTANAQLNTNPSVVFSAQAMRDVKQMNEQSLTRPAKDPVFQDKTAATRTRVYNYVEHLALTDPSITSSSSYLYSPYMWGKPYGQALYSNTSGGLELDTIPLRSYGSVLHPFWSGYNASSQYAKGTMVLTNTNSYVVDSVAFSGRYGRNSAKPGVVDILRVAVTYANGTNSSNFSTGWYSTGNAGRYGVDTVRSACPIFDLSQRTMKKPAGSSGPAIWTKDIQLGPTDTGSRTFKVAPNMTVPAGNIVAATFTFISGEENTYPAGDTIFRGSANTAEPYKYGLFRPYIFFEKVSGTKPGFPTYTPGNYNTGVYAQNPDDTVYTSTFFWSTNGGTGASAYQFPDVDWRISCATCTGLGVDNIESYVSVGMPYPNPANNSITLPLTMKETSAVNATLSNIMGQVIAEQSLGLVPARHTKDVTFNTVNLAEGIYILTVNVNGEQVTKRVAVTH